MSELTAAKYEYLASAISRTDVEERLVEMARGEAGRIWPVFKLNGWTWDTEDIPTEEQIAKNIKELLEAVLKEMYEKKLKTSSVSTGRLMVSGRIRTTSDSPDFELSVSICMGDLIVYKYSVEYIDD